jgi:tRNA threonylcarbamoyladenosine biosynthesis protein TsaE
MELLVSASAEATAAAGERLAPRLRAGDVVAVQGELGSGKTTFIRGACRALGVSDAVTSPTFSIGHLYAAPVPVSHLDLYRFVSVAAADWADLEPYFDGTISFVEWPEHAGAWLATISAWVHITHLDEYRREIRIGDADDPRL